MKEKFAKEKMKRQSFIVLLILVITGIATMVTTFFRYDRVYQPFADNNDVQIIDITRIVTTNDLESKDGGYVIAGPDAYLVYRIEPTQVREIYVEFDDNFAEGVGIEVFTRSTNEVFSQNNAQKVLMSAKEKGVKVPVYANREIIEIRVDIVAVEGQEFRLADVIVDTRQPESILEYFYIPYFIAYIPMGILMVLIGRYRRKILEYISKFNKDHTDATMIIEVWLVLIAMVYGVFLIGKYNLTMTNLMYRMPPWNSLGVEQYGPSLSDPVDTLMASIWKVYYSSGNYSIWNSNIAFGVGECLDNIMYPVNWVYFLPIKIAILLKAIIETSIAYFGMCFLLKKMKLSTRASVFAGISYACSSAMVMWLFWPHTDVMMLAPWAFLLGYNILQQQKVKDALILGIVVYLMIVSGMPTFGAYVIYLLGFFILVKAITEYKRDIKSILKTYSLFGISMATGVLISLPYALDLVGSVVSNGYADSRRHQGRFTLAVEYLQSVFFPYCRNNLQGHINESTLYFGIAGILFVGITIVFYKKIKHYFWIVSGIVLNILLLTHWLDNIYVLLPGINTSSKVRIINVLVFVLCVLAGLGLDAIYKQKAYFIEKKALICRYGMYAIVLVWCSWYVTKIREFVKIETIICVYISLILTMITIEVLLRVKRNSIKRIAILLLVTINILDMRNFIFQYLPRIDGEADIIPEATDSIRYLQENLEENRFFAIGNWVLFPNTNVYYGLNSIASHSFVNTNDDVRKMLTSIDEKIEASYTALHGKQVDNYELLKWCGVKYVVTERANEETVVTEGTLVHKGNDGLDIYELEQYADRLFLSEEVRVYDSAEEVLKHLEKKYYPNTVYMEKTERYEPMAQSALSLNEFLEIVEDSEDYIKANVNVEEERFLVLNEYNDGKWEVYIDGENAEIEKVNYLFKGVYVPKGQHVVEFVYNRDITIYLSILSGMLLLGSIITISISVFRDKRKSQNSAKENGIDEINNSNSLL